MGPQGIDKNQPIRLAEFGARAQKYKAGDICNILYKIDIGLISGIKSLNMRPPAVVLPAERYFTYTAAKMSP